MSQTVAAPLVRISAIDFFAGGGGGSLGLKEAMIEVLAALNHNDNAIATHRINFPRSLHFLADIFKQRASALPKALLGWFSPSCVFHSIARDGQSCDAQERSHAEQIPRFCLALNFRCVMIENVKEFIKWGPLIEKVDKFGQPVYKKGKGGELLLVDGKPVPVMVPDKRRRGEYYRDWVRSMKAMGYTNYEYRLLNAADYGTPQTRVRYFGMFTRPGIQIKWPAATHDQSGRNGLPRWRGVRECLDLTDRGHSIFTRPSRGKKPLSDKTLLRILAGLENKVVGAIGGKGWQFLASEYYGAGQLLYQNNGTRANDTAARSVQGLGWPARTVTTTGGNQFLMTYYRHGGFRTFNQPAATVTTKDRMARIEAIRKARPQQLQGFTFAHQFSNTPRGFGEPARTIVASRRHQYLATVDRGPAHLGDSAADTPAMLQLKALCRQHGIQDVLFRMLKISELKLIMGFPSSYYLGGTATQQKEMLGNAVCPPVSAALARAMLPELRTHATRKLPALRHIEVSRYEQGELFKMAA